MRMVMLGVFLCSVFGCSRIPLASMIRLSQLDPMTVEARDIRAAVRMPHAIRVKPGGARLTWRAKRQEPPGAIQETFVLERDFDVVAQRALRTHVRPEFHFEIFRIAEQDLERLAALRQRLAGWKQPAADEPESSLTIDVTGCRLGSLPNGPLMISTYLRTALNGRFLTVTRDADLRQIAPAPFEDHHLVQCPPPKS